MKVVEGKKFRTKFLPGLNHGCAASYPKTVLEAEAVLKQAGESATKAQADIDQKGFDGSVWDVVIIEAGRSLNGQTFPASALITSQDIFEGVPIYSFVWKDTLRHLDRKVQKEMGNNVFGNLVGQIRNVKWDHERRALIGQAFIDCESTREVLLNQWNRLEGSVMAGLSIDAEGFEIEGRVTRMVRANSVDLVTYPAAGGRFERLVAEVVDFMEGVKFTEENWDGDKSRFTIEQLMRAVPTAVLRSARQKAEAESREVTKEDLKLPFKEPDGRVNVNALRAALAALGGARSGVDLPSDVSQEAEDEVKSLLEEFNSKRTQVSSQEAVNIKENTVNLNELLKVLQSGLEGAEGWPEEVKLKLKETLEFANGESKKVEESTKTEETTPPTASPAPTISPSADLGTTKELAASIKQGIEKDAELTQLKEQLAKAEAEQKRIKEDADAEVEKARKKFVEQSIKHALDKHVEELNIVDAESAAVLMDASGIEVSEDGEVTGLEEALKSLIEAKPFLVKKPEPRGQGVNVKESATEVQEPHQALISRMQKLMPRIRRGDASAIAQGRRIKQQLNG